MLVHVRMSVCVCMCEGVCEGVCVRVTYLVLYSPPADIEPGDTHREYRCRNGPPLGTSSKTKHHGYPQRDEVTDH